MGKRSDFKRIARDNYPTPIEAVYPLVPHLQRAKFYFTEPCAGDGRLALHIEQLTSGRCERWSDIEPRRVGIMKADALVSVYEATMFITNPPWDRAILHPLILKLSDIAPTWLLFDADWMHTKQAAPFMPRLRKVVSVGRVKWIPDSKMTGKDNCCWYLFSTPEDEPTLFFGRVRDSSGTEGGPPHTGRILSPVRQRLAHIPDVCANFAAHFTNNPKKMAETNYTGALDAEQQGDIILDPKTRLGSVGTLDSTSVEVTEGADIVTATVSADKLSVNVTTNGTPGNAVVVVTADKNLDPDAADNEVGIFNITVTPAGTTAVAMTFANVRDRDA